MNTRRGPLLAPAQSLYHRIAAPSASDMALSLCGLYLSEIKWEISVSTSRVEWNLRVLAKKFEKRPFSISGESFGNPGTS
jgi:hypothetical protein